jgi:hypothetical protein
VTHCNHVHRVPVVSVAGELVAQLCLSCDTQLDVDYTSLFDEPIPAEAL